MIRTLIVIAVAVVAASIWYFFAPAGVESVPGAPAVESVRGAPASAAMPTPAELASMPESRRNTLKTKLMDEAAAQPDTRIDENMDMAAGPVLSAAGGFSGADSVHTGSGRVAVYQLPDDSYIVRLEDFRVTNGPALVVALVAHPDPRSAADVHKGYISIGEVKANTGNQNYEVPAQFDVLSFGSVVIWCELFGVMFAAAPLELF